MSNYMLPVPQLAIQTISLSTQKMELPKIFCIHGYWKMKHTKHAFSTFFSPHLNKLSHSNGWPGTAGIYIYIYVCVCVCVCVYYLSLFWLSFFSLLSSLTFPLLSRLFSGNIFSLLFSFKYRFLPTFFVFSFLFLFFFLSFFLPTFSLPKFLIHQPRFHFRALFN